jgi:hypothetical protein
MDWNEQSKRLYSPQTDAGDVHALAESGEHPCEPVNGKAPELAVQDVRQNRPGNAHPCCRFGLGQSVGCHAAAISSTSSALIRWVGGNFSGAPYGPLRATGIGNM